MYQCKRMIITLCVLLCSIAVWTVPAQAAPEDVKLSVHYIYDDTVIDNMDVDIYLVAAKNGVKYEKTSQFEALTVEFDHLETLTSWSDEGQVIATYIARHDCEPVDSQTTDKTGYAVFDDKLTEGIYFVDIENMDYKNGTLWSDPVLVTLPLYSNEENEFTYAVEMTPKVDFKETPERTPPESTKPESTEPEPNPPESTEPEPTPSELLDIPDEDVPLTGTIAWLIIPLALAGIAFVFAGIFGFRKKEEEQ